jgi:hypothetical protein
MGMGMGLEILPSTLRGNLNLYEYITTLPLIPSEKRIETDRGKRSKVVIDR